MSTEQTRATALRLADELFNKGNLLIVCEQNKDVLRSVIEEGFNKGNYPALDALFVPDYKEHQFGLRTTLQEFKEDIRSLRTGFPDLHLTIEDIAAEADMVWIRMTARGTNLGPFIGPPTGKPITITVMDVCRFENGKMVEHWGVPDRFALMAQLGLLPEQFRRNGEG